MRAKLLILTTVGLLGSASCTWDLEPAYPSLLNYENEERVAKELQECDLVFVGTIRHLEDGWFPPTGSLAPSYQRVRFRVEKVIRGEMPVERDFELAYMIMGGQPSEVQWRDDGPYKLNPSYYRWGVAFIVLANTPKYESFPVECSTWRATEDNLARVGKLLEKAADATQGVGKTQ